MNLNVSQLCRRAAGLWPAPVLALAACASGGGEAAGPSGLAPPPIDTTEHRRERERLVGRFVEPAGVRDPRVLAAMRRVPRHLFVPRELWGEAYADHPLPIGHGQTISQPSLVAYMTEILKLERDHRVLEIGTGSGYQAAILAELVREVCTIEIVAPLGEAAERLLARLGYRHVHVRVGDGYRGWPERAPFDAIIVTCAPERVPPALVAQLKPGGRMCLPVGPVHGTQELLLLVKRADGTMERQAVLPVRFVPMTGGDARP